MTGCVGAGPLSLHPHLGMGIEKPVLVENRFPVFQFLGIVCQFCKRFPYRFQWTRMMSPRTLPSDSSARSERSTVNMAPKRYKNARKFGYTSQEKMTTGQTCNTLQRGYFLKGRKYFQHAKTFAHTQHVITISECRVFDLLRTNVTESRNYDDAN